MLYEAYEKASHQAEYHGSFRTFAQRQLHSLSKLPFFIIGICHQPKIPKSMESSTAGPQLFQGVLFQLASLYNQEKIPVFIEAKPSLLQFDEGMLVVIFQPNFIYAKNPASTHAPPMAVHLSDLAQLKLFARPAEYAHCSVQGCPEAILKENAKCDSHLLEFVKKRPATRPELAFEFSSALSVPSDGLSKREALAMSHSDPLDHTQYIYSEETFINLEGLMKSSRDVYIEKKEPKIAFKSRKEYIAEQKRLLRTINKANLLEPVYPEGSLVDEDGTKFIFLGNSHNANCILITFIYFSTFSCLL
jgi:hypothetical protein